MKIQSFRMPSSLIAIGLVLAIATEGRAALSLVNADFQDLTGLTAQPGAPGWYQGVPAGWSSSTGSLNYNLINWNSGNLAPNLQTLGPSSPFAPLYQSAGSLDSTGVVSLSFNVLGFSDTYGMSAAIYQAPAGGNPNSGWTLLKSASYDQTSGSAQTLQTDAPIAAGTPIAVGFWSWAGAPGVDNVGLIPEPSALSLLVAGSLVTLAVSRRRAS